MTKGKYPWKDDQGNIIWKNLFKMDAVSILFLIIVVILIIGFKVDTAKCDEVYNNPEGFCQDYCEVSCELCDFKQNDGLFNADTGDNYTLYWE